MRRLLIPLAILTLGLVATAKSKSEPPVPAALEREPVALPTSTADDEAFEADKITCDDLVDTLAKTLAQADVDGRTAMRSCTLAQIAAVRGPECVARVDRVLTEAPTCGRAWGAVLGCSAASEAFTATMTRQLLDRTACLPKAISALHQARNVDLALVERVLHILDSEKQESLRVRELLALGSLGRNQDGAIRALVEARVERALAGATGTKRVQALEAAGNAGCKRCMPEVRASLRDGDATVRQSAVAALRFLDGTNELCTALQKDDADLVREHAAWSLRWNGANEEDRAACLARAAEDDPAQRVRTAAMESLLILAGEAPGTPDMGLIGMNEQ